MTGPAREKHFIRAWREYRGYSLRKLADMLESAPGVPLMTHANIGRIETGAQPYTQDFLEASARALGVEPADLLTKDPTKEGEVVDLLRILAQRRDEQTMAVLRALAGKTG
ncbi:helix-turn-helix domain-containing protein [Aureimonas sp. AU12]|uniref:helix-turn-helix domain-containing protein n=1 Tax=Aureimonas sp. AU12 TaxID=1638161 RepID=UPI0007855F5E|nr:helix-turn-helix transcriptional regulator [Aureimonas sp. AU12]